MLLTCTVLPEPSLPCESLQNEVSSEYPNWSEFHRERYTGIIFIGLYKSSFIEAIKAICVNMIFLWQKDIPA